MLNRKVNLDVLVAATAIALFLFSAQANPKGVFLCFNDPIIKGDSTQKNFVDCIDANSVNLTINNNKKPYCTVSTSFDIGSHSAAMTLAVTQSTPLKDVGVFIVKNTGKEIVQHEILLEGFVARKISIQGEGELVAKQTITLVPDADTASSAIAIKYRTSGSIGRSTRVIEEDISCKQ